MKFDKIIMNPPFCYDLHLQIAEKCLEKTDDLVCLSPDSWFIDNYAKYKKNSSWNTYKHLFDNIISIEQLNSIKNYFEDASYKTNLAIYKYGDHSEIDLDKIQNNTILDKTVEYCRIKGNSLEDHMGKFIDGHIVIVNRIYGGNWKNGGIIKDYKFRYTGKKLDEFITGNNGSILFNTEEEAKNFSLSAKTKFYSYLLFLHGNSIRWNTKLYPFMQDYTQPWTDERFYKHFGITKEEQKIIEDTMKGYV